MPVNLTPRSTVMYSSGVKLQCCKTREVLGDRVRRTWFAEVEGAYGTLHYGNRFNLLSQVKFTPKVSVKRDVLCQCFSYNQVVCDVPIDVVDDLFVDEFSG